MKCYRYIDGRVEACTLRAWTEYANAQPGGLAPLVFETKVAPGAFLRTRFLGRPIERDRVPLMFVTILHRDGAEGEALGESLTLEQARAFHEAHAREYRRGLN